MYQRILVAVDNTELSQQAFEKALEIAKAMRANLHIISVYSPLRAEYQDTASLAFGSSYYPDAALDLSQEWDNAKAIIWDLLRSFQQQAANRGVQAEITQQIGLVEEEITEFAKSWNADLIVIGSHGRKGFGELLFGSVSNYVSHHVTCSVLLVH